ncbi:MAG TPA: hypothetical protein DGB72_05365 [Gemmatimonadetes bacterium]|nr:hypothetical protein [Gemmatimonadota bacterium]
MTRTTSIAEHPVALSDDNIAEKAGIAETLPELEGSIGVLRKCGFTLIDGGSEPGVIRFELDRAAYAMRA